MDAWVGRCTYRCKEVRIVEEEKCHFRGKSTIAFKL